MSQVKCHLDQTMKRLMRLYSLYSFFTLSTKWDGCSAGLPGRLIPWKDPVPIVQVAWWAPVPFWTGSENLASQPGFVPRTVQVVANRFTD